METRDVAICANRVLWGSLFSGVLTAFFISILLALLGSALGFSMVDPWAQRPAGGIGTTMTLMDSGCATPQPAGWRFCHRPASDDGRRGAWLPDLNAVAAVGGYH